MSLTIDSTIWEKLPGLEIVVVHAAGIDNRRDPEGLGAALAAAEAALRSGWGHPNAQSHPRVAAWRVAFKQLGISVGGGGFGRGARGVF